MPDKVSKEEQERRDKWMQDTLEWYDNQQKEVLLPDWALAFRDRGMGHGDFGVVVKDKDDKLVLECPSREVAEHIVEIHNATPQASRWRDKRKARKKTARKTD